MRIGRKIESMGGTIRADIKPGITVMIVMKQDRKTNDEMMLDARTRVTFKCSGKLRDRINKGK